MNEITKNEALEALNESRIDDAEQFSIVGGPDRLGPVTVFFVVRWYEDIVDYVDVMFTRINGKVKVRTDSLVLA